MAATTDKENTMYTIDRTPARQWTAEYVEVRVALSTGQEVGVAIYGPETRWDGEPQAARVNWSAIGSVSPEDAIAYAGAIALAASIAPTLAPATGEAEEVAV